MKQLCVWYGTLVGDKIKEFEQFMVENFGVRVKYEGEVLTQPDRNEQGIIPGTGGRNDLFFYVDNADVGKFAISRLQAGIRWWEDVLGNGNAYLYPQEWLDAHPKGW